LSKTGIAKNIEAILGNQDNLAALRNMFIDNWSFGADVQLGEEADKILKGGIAFGALFTAFAKMGHMDVGDMTQNLGVITTFLSSFAKISGSDIETKSGKLRAGLKSIREELAEWGEYGETADNLNAIASALGVSANTATSTALDRINNNFAAMKTELQGLRQDNKAYFGESGTIFTKSLNVKRAAG
jgi:hypothetical protein